MELHINNRYKRLSRPSIATKKLFAALYKSMRFPITDGELSVVFVPDLEIGRIHNDFMGDPAPTDVITFPANVEMESAGEIIVSVDHAFDQAEIRGLPFSWELSLYLCHGWLHLAGYDDRNEADRARMKAAEVEALEILSQASAGMAFKMRRSD